MTQYLREPIRCFLLLRTSMGRRSARRISTAYTCNVSSLGCHVAETIFGDELFDPDTIDSEGDFTDSLDRQDPRWPRNCACGYAFSVVDHWLFGVTRLYQHAYSGEMFRLNDDLPLGAMWDAAWMTDLKGFGGPDGQCLVVNTPGGHWIIDGPSRTGGRWTRGGEPPDITVTPSILIHNPDGTERYHGWLRGGFLVPA